MAQQAGETRVTEHPRTDLETELSPNVATSPVSVLFATDGSAAAHAAQEFLQRLPLPPGSAIEVLTVIKGVEWSPTWYLEASNSWGKRVVRHASEELARPGVTVRTATRTGARAYEIIEAADEFRPDLLVIGSQGHTALEAFLIGSITQNVARHAHCSVLVARKPLHGLRSVVLAVDSSPHAAQAVTATTHLPFPADTEVVVAHVTAALNMAPSMYSSDLAVFGQALEEERRQIQQAGIELAERACRQLTAAGLRASKAVPEGDPAAEILKLAEEREADLIITGARGISPIQGLLMGSVADRLLKSARCSLLVVR
jgi:nucleotide-binding universal stress UspA family protein